MLLVYSGRHKAASSWSRAILKEATAALGLRWLTVIAPEQWVEHGSLGALVQHEKPDLLMLTNLRQEDYDTLPAARRTVNVIRDPRDIVVSGYFSHRNTHGVEALGVVWHELIDHRKRLRELDLDEGLLEEIEFSSYFLDHMDSWNYEQPEVLELRMEEQVTDQVAVWTRIFEHYGLLAPRRAVLDWIRMAAVRWTLAPARGQRKRLTEIRVPLKQLPSGFIPLTLGFHTFTRLSHSDRKPGEVDEMNHYRKGVPGDWRNYFTERHLKAFRQRYGDLAERLGYLSD